MKPKPPADMTWTRTSGGLLGIPNHPTRNATMAARWRTALIVFAVAGIALASWAYTWPRESLAFRIYDFFDEWAYLAGMILIGRWCYWSGRRDQEARTSRSDGRPVG